MNGPRVVICGGGLMGLSVAYNLAKRGQHFYKLLIVKSKVINQVPKACTCSNGIGKLRSKSRDFHNVIGICSTSIGTHNATRANTGLLGIFGVFSVHSYPQFLSLKPVRCSTRTHPCARLSATRSTCTPSWRRTAHSVIERRQSLKHFYMENF
jgi:hypothetical protein